MEPIIHVETDTETPNETAVKLTFVHEPGWRLGSDGLDRIKCLAEELTKRNNDSNSLVSSSRPAGSPVPSENIDDHVHVCYCLDDDRLSGDMLVVSIDSICREAAKETYEFHIVFSVERDKVESLCDRITRLMLNTGHVANMYFEKRTIDSRIRTVIGNTWKWLHVSDATFLRLVLPDILPFNVSRAVYLDVDTYVSRGLVLMYNEDLHGNSIGLVPDFGIRSSGVAKARYDIPLSEVFFAGQAVIDLKKCRNSNYVDSMLAYLSESSKTDRDGKVLNDQGVISKVFRGDIQSLPVKYCVPITWLSSLGNASVDKFNSVYGTRYSNVFQMIEDGVVFHYVGDKKKLLLGNKSLCRKFAERLNKANSIVYAKDPGQTIDVCYCVDLNETILRLLITSIDSVLRTKYYQDTVRFHIIVNISDDQDLPPDTEDILDGMRKAGVRVRTYKVKTLLERTFGRLVGRTWAHVSDTMWARLLIPYVLPENVHKVVYLDSDVLACCNMRDLVRKDTVKTALGCVPDFTAYIRYNKPKDTINIQSGLLVVDVDKWRELGMSERLKKNSEDLSVEECVNDQMLLNATLKDHEITWLWPRNCVFSTALCNGCVGTEHTDIKAYSGFPGTAQYETMMDLFCDASMIHYAGNKKRFLFGNFVLSEKMDYMFRRAKETYSSDRRTEK